MSELTDLQLCKRVAEIEGTSLFDKPNDMTGNLETVYPPYMSYNPLTDDALCFQLMVKYKVRMSWLWEENDGTPHYEAYIKEDSSDIKYDMSPNKAILLAIIEANT